MPYLKPIKGHTSCAFVKRYLERGGRDLATDFVNLCEHDFSGNDWASQMDMTRKFWGNDKDHGDKKARTYNHYVLSPNPKDNITLEEFREFMMEFFDKAFEDRFEIAVVYHDDNAANILHAHFIVNNTDITTGKRLAPWLTNKKVHEIRSLCERMAQERGWSNFLEDDLRDAKQIEADVLGKLNPELDAPSFEGISEIKKSKDHPYTTNRDAYYTKTERELLESGGWSWKEDLRDRIRIAREISTTEEGYLRALKILDVNVQTTKQGDYRYTHPENNRWQVNGYRLGQAFSRNGIRSRLADEDMRHIDKPASLQRAKIMSAFDTWRIEGIRTVGYIHPRLNISLSDIADAMSVVNENNIRSMSGFDRVIENASEDQILRISSAKGCVQLLGEDVRSMRAHKGRIANHPEIAIEHMSSEEAHAVIQEKHKEQMKDAPKRPVRTEDRHKKKNKQTQTRTRNTSTQITNQKGKNKRRDI